MYCKNCRARLEENTRFCTSCGTERQQGAAPSGTYGSPVSLPSQRGTASASTAWPKKSKRRGKVFAITVSILLILLGVQSMSLNMVGKTTDAAITDARQDRRKYGVGTPDPRRFRIDYAFSVDGESYAGSARLILKHGVRENQKIRVRYLPYYPAINAPAENTKILGGMLLTGLGTFLLVLGVKGKVTTG